VPHDVQLGMLTSEPGAVIQCAHCDQEGHVEGAADMWQGLVAGVSGAKLMVYTRGNLGTLWEVEVRIPPNHMLVFGGRTWHAGAPNTGAPSYTMTPALAL
jgi:hypothetical protein